MNFFKRLLKFLGIILTAVLAFGGFLSSILCLILLQPGWFINEASLRWASDRVLAPMGIKLKFDNLTPEFAKEDFFKRSLSIKSRAFLLEMDNLRLEVPYLSLQASFDLHPSRFRITRLGPAEILQAKVDFRAGPPEPTADPFELSPFLVEQLNELAAEPLHISFDSISFTPFQERPISSKLDAYLTKDSQTKNWILSAHLEALKVDLDRLAIDLPLGKVGLAFVFDQSGILIRRLGPLMIDGRSLTINLPTEENSSTQAGTGAQVASQNQNGGAVDEGGGRWIEQLKQIALEPSEISWKKVVLKQAKDPPIEGAIKLGLSKPDPATLNFALAVAEVKGAPVRSATLDVAMQIPAGLGFMPLDARIRGRADLAKLGRARLGGELHIASHNEARYDLEANYSYGPSTFTAKSQGRLAGERFLVDLKGQVSHPHSQLEKISLPSCQFAGSVSEQKRPFLDSSLSCVVSLMRVPTEAEQAYQDLLPRSITMNIEGPVTIPVWNDAPQFSAPIRITLEELKSEVFALNGKTDIDLSGILLGPKQSFVGIATIDTRLALARFQSLVKRFEGTDFSIPAPFNTLDGRVQCALQGQIVLENQMVNLPLSCLSELDSSTQTLWTRATGVIQTRGQKKPLVQLDINLEKVTFQLPKLSLEDPIPQILPDKRIAQLTAAALRTEPEPLPVELLVKITTPRGRPLQLSSHLLRRPIPINFDVLLKGDAPTKSGSIAIEDYEVDFLKKKAHVDRLRLVLDPAIETPSLDGLLVFRDPEFRIDLKLSGTLAQPFYSLESQPPRSSSELLSIVLFGSSPDSLDEDSQRSVEETRAAMVDGAVGLLSMYYLAATPIDSVGYNPHTGVFRARVRLGKTLSLSVGSDIEGLNQSVGMRKRLTENWSFETTAETDEENHENKGTAMFRWGRRY